MNGRDASTANWRPLLAVTAAAILLATRARGTAAHQHQPEELSSAAAVDALAAAGPCGDGRNECDWSATSEQHAVKRQNRLDELLLRLANRDGLDYGQNARGSGHVRPRIAAVYAYGGGEQPANGLAPQLPFASGWKSRYGAGGGAGDGGDRVRLWRPFNGDNKRARYAFSSWGGKRSSPHPFEPSAANAINVKRQPAFSSWGGKRAQPTFFNWGGKRSIPDDELDQLTAADGLDGEHSVLKRDVGGSGGGGDVDAHPSTLPSTLVVADAAAVHGYDQSTAKRLCIGGGSSSVAAAGSGAVGGSGGNTMNLQQLFNEFVQWSRKQPEQKKAPFYRNIFSLRTLHSPEDMSRSSTTDNWSRRAGSFYPWGGKRNSRQKGD